MLGQHKKLDIFCFCSYWFIMIPVLHQAEIELHQCRMKSDMDVINLYLKLFCCVCVYALSNVALHCVIVINFLAVHLYFTRLKSLLITFVSITFVSVLMSSESQRTDLETLGCCSSISKSQKGIP
jgi:hypothetical protein